MCRAVLCFVSSSPLTRHLGGKLKSMKTPYAKQPAFTIVELLIVIVVIGILVTIAVVAYSGIQNSANQAANQATIRSYVQAFQLIKAETGSLPTGNYEDSSCLGPDPQPNPCAESGQTASATSTANTKTLLAKYGITSQPGIVGRASGGYLIYTAIYYGEPALLWRVPSNQECVGSGGRFHRGASVGWVDGVTYSSRGTYTNCYMSLRDL